MEVELRSVLDADEGITTYELAGRAQMTVTECATQVTDLATNGSLKDQCRLVYVAQGISKTTGRVVSTVPGPLEEVQTKATNQINEEGRTVTLYCIAPNKDGAPRMAHRRHRSISVPDMVLREYKTMTREESIKTFSRRVSSSGNLFVTSPATPGLASAGTQDLKGLSQMTLNSSSSGQLARQQSTISSAASPTSAPQPKATSSFSAPTVAPKSAPPVLASSTPIVVDKENRVEKKPSTPVAVVKKPAPPLVKAEVVEVEDSPVKPVVCTKRVDPVVDAPASAPLVDTTQEGEVDHVPAPAAIKKIVDIASTSSVKQEAPVKVEADDEEDAMPAPAPSTVAPPPPPPAAAAEPAKKPTAFASLMTAQKKGVAPPAKSSGKKAASKAKPKDSATKKPAAKKASTVQVGKGLVDEEDGSPAKMDANGESDSDEEGEVEKKAKAAELRRYREAEEAPVVLSVANDELELGSFMPLAPVQTNTLPQAKPQPTKSPSSGAAGGGDDGPSPGVKRPRDVMEKESAPAPPTHKDILSFFTKERCQFTKEWTKSVEAKVRKVGNAWITGDVVVFTHKVTGEQIDNEEYKRREAAFVPAEGSPGAALRAASGSADSAGEGAATQPPAEEEPPKKKARKEEAVPAPAKKKVNKKEAPTGCKPISSFFAKK